MHRKVRAVAGCRTTDGRVSDRAWRKWAGRWKRSRLRCPRGSTIVGTAGAEAGAQHVRLGHGVDGPPGDADRGGQRGGGGASGDLSGSEHVQHETLSPMDREEARLELESGDAERVSCALVRLALHEPDRAFVEDVLAIHLQAPDAWVRGVAATCVGHVARVHRAVDAPRLVPLLRRLSADARTAGRVEDALSDIEMFTRRERA